MARKTLTALAGIALVVALTGAGRNDPDANEPNPAKATVSDTTPTPEASPTDQ